MSKTSISRDRWRQAGQANYADWCSGCGLYAVTHGGEHRADCLTLPPECPDCLYHPNVHGHHRNDCPQKDAA